MERCAFYFLTSLAVTFLGSGRWSFPEAVFLGIDLEEQNVRFFRNRAFLSVTGRKILLWKHSV